MCIRAQTSQVKYRECENNSIQVILTRRAPRAPKGPKGPRVPDSRFSVPRVQIPMKGIRKARGKILLSSIPLAEDPRGPAEVARALFL